MRRTTFGETPKKIIPKVNFSNFLKQEEEKLKNNFENCIYENLKFIENPVLNYININPSRECDRYLKSLIRKDFDVLQSCFSYLGNLYVENLLFGKSLKESKKVVRFNKSNYKNFLNSLKNEKVKQIGEFLFTKSKEYSIFIEKSENNNTTITCNDEINFKLPFDDFDYNKRTIVLKNYRYLIVDGFIESVGEIHHLLQKSTETKEPYVIFCFGMTEEVRQTIIKNNRKKITRIYPISLHVEEETLNLLNDIALVHNSDVVSSLKGQTISQAAREDLPIGKKITIKKNSFIVEPSCSEKKINSHKKFLTKKMNKISLENNKSIDLIKKRIKYISSKTINIYLNELDSNDNNFLNELDYLLRFITHIGKKFIKIKTNFRKSVYYLPEDCIELVNKKINSTKKIIENIETIILKETS